MVLTPTSCHYDKSRNHTDCDRGIFNFQYVLQHFHRLSVLHGGIFADNLFCRNLHEARRTNEYVQPEC